MTRRQLTGSLVALALFTGAAHAQTPVQASAGCYVPGSGTVYLINVPGAPTACATGHTPVTVQRPSPLAHIFTVDSTYDLAPGTAAVALACPDTATAISAGFESPMASIYGVSTAVKQGNGFAFGTFNSGPGTVSISVQVYCVPN